MPVLTPFPDCPTPEQAQRAMEHLFDAAWEMAAIAKGEGSWDRFVGHVQDGLAEVSLEPHPLKTPAPATAEALFDDAAYSHSRGGM